MNMWELGKDDIEAVLSLEQRGLSRQEVASALGISYHMVVCAERKARRTPRPNALRTLLNPF